MYVEIIDITQDQQAAYALKDAGALPSFSRSRSGPVQAPLASKWSSWTNKTLLRPVSTAVVISLAEPGGSVPLDQDEAITRYEALLEMVRPDTSLTRQVWLKGDDDAYWFGRRFYGAKSIQLKSEPSAGAYTVTLELELDGPYFLAEALTNSAAEALTTDAGEPLYGDTLYTGGV